MPRHRLAFILLVVSGCTRDSDLQGNLLASEEIGVEGGTLAAPDGPRIVIPSGALLESVMLTIERIDAPSLADASLVGDAFLLGPEGQVFDQRVRVELPIRNGATDDVVVLTGPRGSSSYATLPAEIDGAIARVETTHFSWFAPGVVSSGSSMDASVAIDATAPTDATINDDASEDAAENDAGTIVPDASVTDAQAEDGGVGCGVVGQPCVSSTDCCNGTCNGGICQGGGMCSANGGPCTADSECCSGACVSGSCSTIADDDGDGFTSDVDCDDSNPSVHPGATEACNGIDDNCSAGVDETCCALGETVCNGMCVDTNSNPMHCQMCNAVCPTGQICVNAVCQLPGG